MWYVQVGHGEPGMTFHPMSSFSLHWPVWDSRVSIRSGRFNALKELFVLSLCEGLRINPLQPPVSIHINVHTGHSKWVVLFKKNKTELKIPLKTYWTNDRQVLWRHKAYQPIMVQYAKHVVISVQRWEMLQQTSSPDVLHVKQCSVVIKTWSSTASEISLRIKVWVNTLSSTLWLTHCSVFTSRCCTMPSDYLLSPTRKKTQRMLSQVEIPTC